MMRWILKGILFISGVVIMLACEREFVYRGGVEGLNFSSDTVTFDTIFTSIGSTTKNFRVYNPYDEDMVIESIELAGGDNSDFRLNINGFSQNQLEEVPIYSRDSLYIFVEVTIDPIGSNAPLLVTDSVYFRTKEKTQTVQLIAYGQDVVLMKQEWLKSQTLTKDKPYLIYDFIVVDTLETVNIDPGAKLYFYKDASLHVQGTLNVNGSKDEPVVFASHRQEDWYADKPGQWGYISLLPGSGNSKFNNAIIKNSMIGILTDSVGTNESKVQIHNTRIEHISTYGMLAQTSAIEVSNSVFGDCGNSSVALTVGGEYKFSHCTFANYFNWSFRTNPTVFLNNYYINKNGDEIIVPLKEATFNNSIIYGNNISEIGFDLKYHDEDDTKQKEADASYRFSHALIKLSDDFDISDKSKFTNIIRDKAPSFVNIKEYNYQLDTLSAAKDKGDRVLVKAPFNIDLLEFDRLADDRPDLGAYERQEKK